MKLSKLLEVWGMNIYIMDLIGLFQQTSEADIVTHFYRGSNRGSVPHDLLIYSRPRMHTQIHMISDLRSSFCCTTWALIRAMNIKLVQTVSELPGKGNLTPASKDSHGKLVKLATAEKIARWL